MSLNPFIANLSPENSTRETLEAFIKQLELQKKMTNLFAIRGLQEYIKQYIQFSMFQESLREKLIELQNQLSPQIPSVQHSSRSTSINEQQDFMKISLEKMLEETLQQRYQNISEIKTQDSPKISEETSNETKEYRYSSSNLEDRIRESILNKSANKISHSKHISKTEFSAFDPANQPNIKPWKCDHEVHFAKGYCKVCFQRIQNKVCTS